MGRPVALVLSLLLLTINESFSSPRNSSKFRRLRQAGPGDFASNTGSGSVSGLQTAGGQQAFIAATTPTPVQCTAAGFFPTPGSCVKFHRCVDFSGFGIYFSVFRFDCPAGTIFDPALGICNHEWAVTTRPECNGVVAPQTSRPATQPPTRPPTQVTTDTTNRVPSRPVTVPTGPTGSPIIFPGVGVTERPGSVGSSKVTTDNIDSIWTPTTTTSPSEEEEDPIICFRDQIYRIHPHYCNMYYYCEDYEIVQFTCPAGLIFDSTTKSCAKDVKCPTKVAPLSVKPLEVTDSTTGVDIATETPVTSGLITVRPTTTESVMITTTEVTEEPTTYQPTVTTEKVWEIAAGSLYDCGAPGYYPFEGDCIRFYKCVETDDGKLTGLLYRCPPKFAYSEERKRCEREELLPTCTRVPQASHTRLNIENATPLYPKDISWFFKN